MFSKKWHSWDHYRKIYHLPYFLGQIVRYFRSNSQDGGETPLKIMAVQITPIICIVFLKILNFPNFKHFFIDFFEKNDLHVVLDLNFFLAWFENEYHIYQLHSKGYILSILIYPLAIRLPLQKPCCKHFFQNCTIIKICS